MELRKAEAEVDELRAEYDKLRLVAVGDADQHHHQQPDLSSVLPPLLDLLAQVQQDRPAPSTAPEVSSESSGPAASDGAASSANSAGNGASGGDMIATSTADADADADAGVKLDRTISAKEALGYLGEIKSRLDALDVKCQKFRKRLGETDPVTGAPRYGAKTATRVVALLHLYDALTIGISAAYGTDDATAAVHSLLQCVENEEGQREQAEADAHGAAMKEAENAKLAAQKREEEERQKAMEMERERIRQEAELHQQALEARQRREEEEARARAEEREADRAFQDSIQKGPDGVRAQLTALREGCSNEPGAFDVAIGALHTLFSQIAARPEEIKFRRIRRDHPKFLQDIGRHSGGKEVFVAAGFKLETLDGVKSFFSKEPDLESDMDGWSEWFDGLKRTL
eukprot:CAMPEP_0181057558 /NCGR_PEP_ID=MMETSP1070-20121207/20315_1 /TAXON_ID=265543 /ORGANISM="Minutocellus polymorphus, Strain NH13" /LENGTH=400 /DNA_ID=CAMNT_0023136981 /DNA_START=160 /DNA_END=1359 /DNA_ORIENTATION=-